MLLHENNELRLSEAEAGRKHEYDVVRSEPCFPGHQKKNQTNQPTTPPVGLVRNNDTIPHTQPLVKKMLHLSGKKENVSFY